MQQIGWKSVQDSTSNVTGINPFIAATGGTVTCCGDYKIHTFTGPGTFTVTNAGNPSNNIVDYLVVAGGGGEWRQFFTRSWWRWWRFQRIKSGAA
jgi:hypothetical protein